LNFTEYQIQARRTVPEFKNFNEKMLNAAMGLVGESGEVMDLLKKERFQGHKVLATEYANELGDIMWYLNLMADAIGYTLEEIAEMNIEKLKKRYPEGFSIENSVHRAV
jgi:NTP pyrophosphatase (non-canonical NTP hydrolase)